MATKTVIFSFFVIYVIIKKGWWWWKIENEEKKINDGKLRENSWNNSQEI